MTWGGRLFTSPGRRSWAGVHDAVVAAPGPGAAGAGAVAAQHLRGGPAVQLHQVALRATPIQPGVAEMVTEPVRIDRDPALAAAGGNHLVDAVGGHRRPVIHPEPQLRPVCLGMTVADPDVAVEATGGIMADLDDPRLAALAADRDLAAPQVNVTAQRVVRIVADSGQLRQPDAARGEHGDNRLFAAPGERPALARPLQCR